MRERLVVALLPAGAAFRAGVDFGIQVAEVGSTESPGTQPPPQGGQADGGQDGEHGQSPQTIAHAADEYAVQGG